MSIKRIAAVVLTPLLIFAATPLYAAASALEAASPGLNVLGLPTPVITGIDPNNGIVQLKADGYVNNNADLLVTVALVKDNGDIIDTAEKKVSDPDNIRISLHIEQIQVGDSIYAKFVNHGIDGDSADRIHDAAEPEPEDPAGSTPPSKIIIEKGGSSSVKYIVKEVNGKTITVEKLIELEPEDPINIIREVPVYMNSMDNTHSGKEDAGTGEPETSVINTEDMTTLGELLENTKINSETVRPTLPNIKIIVSLLLILIAVLIIFTAFMARFYLSRQFDEIRQPLNVFDFTKQTDDKTA